MGNDFLLVFPDYYGDGFDGRRGGFLVTTLGIARCSELGITGFCMIFD
jgi:hypothetical protein